MKPYCTTIRLHSYEYFVATIVQLYNMQKCRSTVLYVEMCRGNRNMDRKNTVRLRLWTLFLRRLLLLFRGSLSSGHTVYQSYPDGQSVSNYLTLEPFVVLFCALSTLYLLLHRCTVSISLYGHANCTVLHWFNSHRICVVIPLFLSSYDLSGLCRCRNNVVTISQVNILSYVNPDPCCPQMTKIEIKQLNR